MSCDRSAASRAFVPKSGEYLNHIKGPRMSYLQLLHLILRGFKLFLKGSESCVAVSRVLGLAITENR